MQILEKMKFFKHEMIRCNQAWEQLHDKSFEMNRKAGNLIRYTHSMEKGMSIAEPRLGFGHEKQRNMISLMEELRHSKDGFHQEAVMMAVSALRAYVDYHIAREYDDEMIRRIAEYLSTYSVSFDAKEYGGVMNVDREGMNVDREAAEKLFLTRHSIRDFEDSEVDESTLMCAVKLAQKAPSACNRQGVRVYIINHNHADALKKWTTGTGGFEKAIKEFILITAKQSVYDINERYQYIVSASMYAAYLSLTLHAYGLGACVIQRGVVFNEGWREVRDRLNIPKDEQVICILGVGNLKDRYVVPVSHRLREEVFIKRI